MRIERTFLFLVLFLGAAEFGRAIPAAPNTGGIEVAISERPSGVRLVEGRFSTIATMEGAKNVLVDYEHLSKFVSSVQSSRVVRVGSGYRVVDQVMTGKLGPFRKKIFLRLEVYETPTSVSFRDSLGRSFKSYHGSWGLIDHGNNVEVTYELRAEPAFYSPEFLTKGAFRKAVQLLLAEVKREIENRSSPR